MIKTKFSLSQTSVTADHMKLVLIIYIANMIYSCICLRENELNFNHLHSQNDLQLHMFDHVGYLND
jgi:hypothetical protein